MNRTLLFIYSWMWIQFSLHILFCQKVNKRYVYRLGDNGLVNFALQLSKVELKYACVHMLGTSNLAYISSKNNVKKKTKFV